MCSYVQLPYFLSYLGMQILFAFFPRTSSNYRINYLILIKNFLNPEGHQNAINGSKVWTILLKEWILPIGRASVGEGLRLNNYNQKKQCKKISSFLQHTTSINC